MIEDDIKLKIGDHLKGEQTDFVVFSKASKGAEYKMGIVVMIGLVIFFVPFFNSMSDQMQQLTETIKDAAASPEEFLERGFFFLISAGFLFFMIYRIFANSVEGNCWIVATPSRILLIKGKKVLEYGWSDFTGKTILTKNKSHWEIHLYLRASVGERANGRGVIAIYGVDKGPQIEQAIRYRISQYANSTGAILNVS